MNTHLINGSWIAHSDNFFQALDPAENCLRPKRFAEGGEAEVEAAAQAAREAFADYASLSVSARAAFLRAIASQIDKRGDEITLAAGQETALPAARLEGERGRTVNQLRMFADFIESGRHLDIRHDAAQPARAPLPRPDMYLVQKPIGIVGIFGASNFPLAFSVAGGDTASALAAGCPVIVKGHPAHPHTGEIVATAVAEAMTACNIPPGVFSFIQGSLPALSQSVVTHPLVSAVGFTGSLRAGRALFDLACQRAAPIPFYAEMGSINPVFVMPAAASEETAVIAKGWAQSLVLGGGQFCTNPGVLFCPAAMADKFGQTVIEALANSKTHTMLTPGIATTYRQATVALSSHLHWCGAESEGNGCVVSTNLYACNISEWLQNKALQEEIFGPAGIIISYENIEELSVAVHALSGQLTTTIWLTAAEYQQASALLPFMEQKSGRLIVNGFPTGVEVADAMMHGGPYPAASYLSTSVGSLSIRRFLRPLCYQNFPPELLPPELQSKKCK